MQQTQKYKLNLIERSDPFLPEGLNQNTQKVEDVLKGMEDGPLASMDQRVTVLEGHKMAYGTFSSTTQVDRVHFSLGFPPKVVLYMRNVSANGIHEIMMSVRMELGENGSMPLTDDGFDVLSFTYGVYHYVAFG